MQLMTQKSVAEKTTYLKAITEFKQLRADDPIFASQYGAAHFKDWLNDYSIHIQDVEYHRNPTSSEIKFGEGAIHYKSFSADIYLKPSGEIKKRLICPFDGLHYTR